MKPLSADVPKPLLPVADRPIVAHTADAAIDAGATELTIVVGYQSEAVREYFGDQRRDVPIHYALQEERAGTADAVAAARDHLEGPFAVLNGDNLYTSEAIERLFEHGPAVAAVEVDDPSNYGVLRIEDDIVTEIVEKPSDPPSRIANAGAYVFPANAREWLDVAESERGEHEITDVLARTIEEFSVTPIVMDRWMDVGRPWELLEANEWKLGELDRRLEGDVSSDADVRGNVVVEAGARIEPGVTIEGPALIRAGASVGPNAYIRGATLIDENATVGHAVEVKNSVLMTGATAGHLAYVGDSLLGTDVNLGAGTTVANLRHDDQPVKHTVKGERVSTGRRKFGVVLGPRVKTGINTSLSPGLSLSPDATTEPGETITRDR